MGIRRVVLPRLCVIEHARKKSSAVAFYAPAFSTFSHSHSPSASRCRQPRNRRMMKLVIATAAVGNAAERRSDAMLKELTLGIAIGVWAFYAMFARDFAAALKPYVFRLYVLLSVARTTSAGTPGVDRVQTTMTTTTETTEEIVAHKEVHVRWRMSGVVRNLMVAYCVLFVVMLAHARDVVQRVVIPEPIAPLTAV